MPHFITSAQPEDHITSANDAHLYAGLFGNGNYLLNVRELMAVTMIDSNTLRILGGDALTCGRHWEITGDYEEVSIDNGVPGFNRIDLVVAHIETAPQESISLRVIKGQETENTPTVPGHVTGDLNDGDTVTEVPICSVRINGINPSEPVKLLTTILPTITDLINTDRLADALITNTKLADGSVSLAKIIDGAVGNTKLAANAVSEDKIQNGVISANKLASNSVNAAKIVNGSVGTAELANAAVTTAKIADKNVTLAKLDQSLQNSISQTGVTNGWFWVKYPKNKYAIAFKRVEKANFAFKTGDPYEFFKETLPFSFTFGAASGSTASNRPTIVAGGGNYRIASLYCNEDSCNSTTLAVSGKCNYSGTATLRVYLAVAGQYT